jgi:hypothetical protein
VVIHQRRRKVLWGITLVVVDGVIMRMEMGCRREEVFSLHEKERKRKRVLFYLNTFLSLVKMKRETPQNKHPPPTFLHIMHLKIDLSSLILTHLHLSIH